ncbi:Pre-peptidase C-terminal domain-containing protein [Sulfidibacter corallicola]|uniref:Pre-peptidase C-terminal domain-containing protein n=1 Tax=Sulfidibacter corallicola TaxID=2818388 RepID=A0A8A4TK39_SULCO|nr:CUB domain-containing protein [Sulfidibacter corallicola]QTD49231.1 pre-peptidase C-terminal domain-containing protein [Sulfidibacter corallicola]
MRSLLLFLLLVQAALPLLALPETGGPCRVGPSLQKHIHGLYRQQPELEALHRKAEAQQQLDLQRFSALSDSEKKAPIYTIPVVFHVMTWQSDNGNDGYVTDAKIHEALEIVNREFNAQNGVFDDIVPAFAGIVADPRIEFVLAQRDPDGNPTSGITRDVTIHTYNGLWSYPELKRVNSWPHDKYLNVWVVQSSDGSNGSAWAYLPSQVDEGSGLEDLDGIVISTWALGATTPGYHSILTHEIGHSLNLRHTWGPGTHGSAEACSEDDGVSDTPNCSGTSGCDTSASTCGSLDMVQNFMDYAKCPIAFSQGQVTRMHAALNSQVALRNQLWTQNNLVDTGIVGSQVRASFLASGKRITPNESVDFTDRSVSGSSAITSWSWSFPGGSPSAHNGATPPPITYAEAGAYDVVLTVNTASGATHQTHRRRYIQVSDDLAMHPGTALIHKGTFTDAQPTRYYDHDVDHTLTAYPRDNGQMLRFSFAEFRLADSDQLRIYDGTSTSAPLIGTYTGSNSPGVIRATNASGAITFWFIANGSGNHRGWEAGFDYVDDTTFIMQSGTFSTGSGVFVDPGLHGNYGVEYNETMTLSPSEAGKMLRVVFTSFMMEDVDENCEYDYLEIYDGTGTSSPAIGTFCSAGSPGIITASNAQGALTFRFVSDNNRTGPGWSGFITLEDPGGNEYLMKNGQETTSGGIFLDGGKYADYSDDTNQTLTFHPQSADQKLRVTFASFLMEGDDADCEYDTLEIFDGTNTSATKIGTFCNSNSPGVVSASDSNGSGALTFRFLTDDNTTGPGWSSLIEQVDTDATQVYTMQSGTVQAESGIFIDSGRYGSYANDENRVMTIVPPSGNPLTFTFGAFSMEPSDRTCLYDYLEIYDGTDTSAPLVGTYCNISSPGKVTATNPSGALTFRFVSDDNTIGHGWAAHFSTEAGPPNQSPVVSITAPADGATYEVGDAVSFAGSADDAEDGDLAASLSWSSSRDGVIGSGASFSVSTLSEGIHVITASVSDSAGATESDSVTITVEMGSGIPVIGNGQTIEGLSASQDEWLYFRMIVPENTRDLTFEISGGFGDADLYTRLGAQPTRNDWDCRPYSNGNNETCTVANPSAGEYFIGIRAYNSFGNLQLTASYQIDTRQGFTETDLAAAHGDWLHFTIEIPAGASQLDIDIEGGSGDADLYVRNGAQPTKDDWDYRPYIGGNRESVDVASPQAGTWHVSLRGYNAFSGVTLTVYYEP